MSVCARVCCVGVWAGSRSVTLYAEHTHTRCESRSHINLVLHADGTAMRSSLVKHFIRMRASAWFGMAKFVIFIETNSDWGKSDDYAMVIQKMVPNVDIVSGDKDPRRRKGVVTTHESKEAGLIELQERLDTGTISFSDRLISHRPTEDIAELLLQMARFRRDVDAVHAKSVLTGKGNGAQQDDLVMSLQQCLILAKTYIQHKPHFVL